MMTFLCDPQQIERDLHQANGNRTHGRLELDDLDRARDQRDDQEIIVVVGTPESTDPDEKVTLVVILQQEGYAVAHAEETTVADAEHVKSFNLDKIDCYFPELVAHLNEVLYWVSKP